MTTSIDTAPQRLNLSLYAGDGFTVMFVFTDDDEPWDASGDWVAQVREETSSDDTIVEFAVDDTSAAIGQIQISLTGDQVRSILAYRSGAVWDLQQTATGEEPRTWYRGRVTVSEDVSRV